MTSPEFDSTEDPKDLGFGSVVGGVNEKRLLNRDGSFNPRRKGLPLLSSLSPYHFFLTMRWSRFVGVIIGGYAVGNTLFALAYLACGTNSLVATNASGMGT